jgi:hypothetical protein
MSKWGCLGKNGSFWVKVPRLLWRRTPVIPTLRRLRQENLKLKASLSYIMRPYLEKPRVRDVT